jgi:hypothetical protein
MLVLSVLMAAFGVMVALGTLGVAITKLVTACIKLNNHSKK